MTKKEKYLFFDTEMSGCEQIVSIGYIVTDSTGDIVEKDYFLVKPRKPIRKSTIAIHGITTEQAKKEGISLRKALGRLYNVIKDSMVIVGYAPQNDILAMAIGARIIGKEVPFLKGESIVVDVARLATPFMLEKGLITPGQTPNLGGLYIELFDGEKYDEHNALNDAVATAKCFWRLMESGYFNFSAILPYHKIKNLCQVKSAQKPQKKKDKKADVESEVTTTVEIQITEETMTVEAR